MEKEISIIGWWCVFHSSEPLEPIAMFSVKGLAETWIGQNPNRFYEIKEITAKVDFTFEQIQAELSKRVDKVQAVCFENPKL